MTSIAGATLEQERGIEQVSTTVTQMDNVVQQDAAAIQKSAAASDQLRRDAADLAHIVSRFRLEAGAESETPLHLPAHRRDKALVSR
jgi:methyl-accepting chemotaxis protein